MRDKREDLGREKKAGFLGKLRKNQRKKEMRFLRENSKEREKSGDLSLEILDVLKKIR